MKGYKPITYNWFDKPKKRIKDFTYPEAKFMIGLPPHGDADRDGRPNYLDCRPCDSSRQGIFSDIATGLRSRFTPEEEKVPKRRMDRTLDEFGASEEEPDDVEWVITKDEKKKKTKQEKLDIEEDSEPTIFGKWKEKKETKKKYKKALKTGDIRELEKSPSYLVVKPRGEKWQSWGPYSNEQIEAEYHSIALSPSIEQVLVTQNPNLAKEKNVVLSKRKYDEFYDKAEEGFAKRGMTMEQLTRGAHGAARDISQGIGEREDVRRFVSHVAAGPGGPPKIDVNPDTGEEGWFRIKSGPGTGPSRQQPRRIIRPSIGGVSGMSSAPSRTKTIGFRPSSDRGEVGPIDDYEEEEVPQILEEETFMERQPAYKERNVYMTHGRETKPFRSFVPYRPVFKKPGFAADPSRSFNPFIPRKAKVKFWIGPHGMEGRRIRRSTHE